MTGVQTCALPICIKFQFCINIFLRLRTNGWYVVTKGKICLRVFFFCCRSDCLFVKLTSDSVVCIILWGYPRIMRRDLKFEILSSNVVSEEFVLSSLSASPLIKPLFTPSGWLTQAKKTLSHLRRRETRHSLKQRQLLPTNE